MESKQSSRQYVSSMISIVAGRPLSVALKHLDRLGRLGHWAALSGSPRSWKPMRRPEIDKHALHRRAFPAILLERYHA